MHEVSTIESQSECNKSAACPDWRSLYWYNKNRENAGGPTNLVVHMRNYVYEFIPHLDDELVFSIKDLIKLILFALLSRPVL